MIYGCSSPHKFYWYGFHKVVPQKAKLEIGLIDHPSKYSNDIEICGGRAQGPGVWNTSSIRIFKCVFK